jgi:hypothetical protein
MGAINRNTIEIIINAITSLDWEYYYVASVLVFLIYKSFKK